jgi:hypothetical protein
MIWHCLQLHHNLGVPGGRGSAITDDLIAFGENEDWQDSILKYAIEYSHQVKKYYAFFLTDYKKGVLKQDAQKGNGILSDEKKRELDLVA